MKKLNFKVAITSDEHLNHIQAAALVAGGRWEGDIYRHSCIYVEDMEGNTFMQSCTYVLCTKGVMVSTTQEEFEHSKLPLLHSAAQIQQLGKMPSSSNSSKFQEGDPIYLVDLLRSPCVSEGYYDGGYEEADYYNLVYPRNSEGFFSAVEKAKQLLELALIPF